MTEHVPLSFVTPFATGFAIDQTGSRNTLLLLALLAALSLVLIWLLPAWIH